MTDFNYCPDTRPQDNFYGYVNNMWKKENPIPADQQRWCSFTVLNEENLLKVKEIVETKGSIFNTLYVQGLDEDRRNNFPELYTYINKILSMCCISDLINLISEYIVTIGIKSPFTYFVYSDYNESKMNILHLGSSGLGLPDRDYYFLEEKKETRNEYIKFLSTLFKHLNLDLNSNDIFNVELKLAEKTYTSVERRKPELQNNVMIIEDCIKKYPFLNCLRYMFSIDLTKKINISNPKYIENLNELFTTIDLSTWKQYFISRLLLSNTTYLSTDIEKISFDFYGTFLTGVKIMKPLWKRSIHTTESQLGELIGQEYVKKHFSVKAKTMVEEMINYIKKTLKTKISNLPWMNANTKDKALAKLHGMGIKIGYPDKWRVFTSDVKSEYSYLKNNLNCNIADNIYEFNKLYKPIDMDEFYMYPQMVNAYYSPSRNEIVFPAGILQPPFFSENYDMALNFGAIGAVIGHEITHGFDDQGCKYDVSGNLNNWWSSEDLSNYNMLTNKIRIQYDKCVVNNKNVNGSLTLGENIADIGGVGIALSAFLSYLEENNIEVSFETHINRFFSAYATLWRSNCTKEYVDKQILTDPHSPSELRVNCVLQNIEVFRKYYFVLPSDTMYNNEIVNIW